MKTKTYAQAGDLRTAVDLLALVSKHLMSGGEPALANLAAALASKADTARWLHGPKAGQNGGRHV